MIRGNLAATAALAASVAALGFLTPAVAAAGSGKFVRIQSGQILCDVLYQEVFCEYPPGFAEAPVDPGTGQPFKLVVIETSGRLQWKSGGLSSYPDPEMPLDDRQAYHMYGWVIQPTPEGTRFISDFTAHGMVVDTADARPF